MKILRELVSISLDETTKKRTKNKTHKTKKPSFVAGNVFMNMVSSDSSTNVSEGINAMQENTFKISYTTKDGQKKTITKCGTSKKEAIEDLTKSGCVVNNVEEITESQQPKIKPRANLLHQLLATKKGGGHYSEKSDFKRSKEKQKIKKELKDID